MIQWVYEHTVAAGVFDEVIVATPDEIIAEVVAGFGGCAEMTTAEHATGTDRVGEVAERWPDAEVIANVQGDQPFVDRAQLEALMRPWAGEGERPDMSTIAAPLQPGAGADPNVVKVLCDLRSDALYFSRADVPFRRSAGPAPVFHHIGLYAFSREFLARLRALEGTPLEEREGLEQLRALEHGARIRVTVTDASVIEINTPADLDAAEAWLTGR